MAHKVHQKIFRIKEMKDWETRGFYKSKDFSKLLEEDFVIREFLNEKLKKVGIESIKIERFPSKTNVIISTLKPGFIIGRGGKGIEDLKVALIKEISKIRKLRTKNDQKKEEDLPMKSGEIRLDIQEVKNPWGSAILIAQWMAQQIERRVAFRRVLKQALSKTDTVKEIKGCRVQVAGRLNGVEIARKEWLQQGKMPRNNLRADIDYAAYEANCTYGVVGIKVWVYKGEKFEEKQEEKKAKTEKKSIVK
ncbi:MAG: 30S ribosomal protein S3 [Patescibacteria group bacterium]